VQQLVQQRVGLFPVGLSRFQLVFPLIAGNRHDILPYKEVYYYTLLDKQQEAVDYLPGKNLNDPSHWQYFY
jgi:hypothetical protein